MAISPLALGIGLQGKYDYRQKAALEIARSKGRAKAEADADAAKAKNRAPYERALMKVDTSGLLPYQAKLIKEKYADALQAFEDTPDDYSLHAANMQDINSASKAFRDQAENYKRLSIQQGGMPADVQALKVIGTLSDRDQINQELGKLGPATSIAFANDQFVFDNPKYTGTGESIAKSINSMQFELLEGAPVITVGDKKFAGVDINKNVPALITANIMSDANRKKSAINDYLQFSIDNDIPYDFSTPESTNEFLNNTTAWVQKKAQTDVDTRSKELNVTPAKGMSFTYNAPGVEDVNRINPAGGGDIILKYKRFSKDPQTATPLGNVAVGNYNALLTNNTRMIDVNTGDNINKAQVVDTEFNEMKIFYVTKKDYADLPAGLIVPNGFVDKAIELGLVEPKILVFGKQKGSSGKSVYFPVDNVALSQMMKTTPKDRPAIEELQNTLENKRKEIEAKLPQKGTTPAPKPKPSPAPAPKPKGGEMKSKGVPKAKQKDFNSLID